MTTFKQLALSYQKNRDDKSQIVIQITHFGKKAYVNTGFYATDRQLDEVGNIKDRYLIRKLEDLIEQYEEVILKQIGNRITSFTVKELKDYLIKATNQVTDGSIDFVKFSRSHIEKIKFRQKSRSRRLNTTLNAFIDFIGRDLISISEITLHNLEEFTDYLYAPHEITRKNQVGTDVTYQKPPLTASGVYDYIADLRTLFNAARKKYNDYDKGLITIHHYPFATYKMPITPEPTKRALKAETVARIINCPDITLNGSQGINRANMSRDVFTLIFYLVGINTIDLYNADKLEDGRITYKRTKTKGKRKDQALISIKVEPEVLPLIEHYRDATGKRVFNFHQLYSSYSVFNAAVNKGLKYVANELKLKVQLSTYYARHSWATIARNDCAISKDDVHLALNHIDEDLKVTDKYIYKDWTVIDVANRKVIDFVKLIT